MVVESAVGFREQLMTAYYLAGQEEKHHEAGRLPIYYNGANYLTKVCNDTAFLADSEYAKLFNISKKSDPFLVAAAVPSAAVRGVSKYPVLVSTAG